MQVLEGIKQKNFLVIGRVGMDMCPEPAGSAVEDATTMMVAMGGSSANIAAGLVKFGMKASLVTRVSDDAVGRYCVNQLGHYGVDTTHVKPIAGEFRNSLALYETRVENHNSVIYRNGAADFQMSIEDVEAVDYSQFGALITAGTVFAAEPSRSAAFRAFELAKVAGIPVIFDVDYRPYSWPSQQMAEEVLSKAGDMSDIIVANDEEFGFMAGGIEKGLAKAESLANLANGSKTKSGIFKVDALKPTGAGDSFMAGFIASLAEGYEMEEAVSRGSACAAIVVAKPGCAPAMPNNTSLEAFLAIHPGASTPV
jgi:5-dehydro-2-deoxygluconokinase